MPVGSHPHPGIPGKMKVSSICLWLKTKQLVHVSTYQGSILVPVFSPKVAIGSMETTSKLVNFSRGNPMKVDSHEQKGTAFCFHDSLRA